jgi:hypothetical protein
LLGLGCPKQAFAKIATPRLKKKDSQIALLAINTLSTLDTIEIKEEKH